MHADAGASASPIAPGHDAATPCAPNGARRRRRIPLRGGAVALVIIVAGLPALADPLPRVAHVTRALAAVRGLGADGRDRLDRELYAAARARCHADAGAPAVSCLVGAARDACAADPDRARCEAAADVIVTNLRATTAWVDEPTRIRLVRGSTDYRTALAAELRRRYATLAGELVLSGTTGGGATRPRAIDERSGVEGGGVPDGPAGGAGVLPRAIDVLCAERDRAIHACEPGDTACVPSLPWSRCVAALVWFIGGTP